MTSKQAIVLVSEFESALQANATLERAEYEKKYHKSSLRFIGSNVGSIRRECSRFWRQSRDLLRKDLDVLINGLWRTDCHELRSVAICLMTRYADLYSRRDLPYLQNLIIESAGWAHVDWISTDLLGAIYSAEPKSSADLRKWSRHNDFWVRRASLLALLDEARHGNRAAFDLFAEFASKMIEEKEFFIRKAIGWVLREVSKKQPEWSFEFLLEHAAVASGLTMREGSKYLPHEMRARLK